MANEQPDARRPEPLLKSDSILTSSKTHMKTEPENSSLNL